MNSSARAGLRHRQLTIRLAAPVLAAGLLVAACGGSASSSAGGGASTPAASGGTSPGAHANAGQAAFLQCLRKNGVTLPAGIPTSGSGQAPGSGQLPGGIGQGKAGKAFQACRKLAPAGFHPGGTSGSASAIRAFTSCMKDHGITLSGTGISALTSLSHRSGKTGKAFRICQALLPQGLPH
jgi:hypothetical protein